MKLMALLEFCKKNSLRPRSQAMNQLPKINGINKNQETEFSINFR